MRDNLGERRVHNVYVTRNTEYHVRHDRCVGVRDRRTGEWLPAHMALHHSVKGSLRFLESGAVNPHEGSPRVGDSLFFYADGRDLVTSAVVAVERPPRDIVAKYEQKYEM